jgi:FKBP-type peptidyl-prolyl cis-trans isomerase FklB
VTFKPTSILALCLLLPTVTVAQEKPALENPQQRGSYAIGADIAANFKRQQIEVDVPALTAGFAEAWAGKSRLTAEELRAAADEFRKTVMAQADARNKVTAEKNLKDGEAYLAANAGREGVKTTTSGLQYKVLKTGSGPSPKATDTVKVHYHGTLIDGTVFDSSVDRGEPATFQVGGVIRGWVEALQLMHVGDKWQVSVPAKLAYGERSPGGAIGPNSTLIFDVELLGIE